MAGVTVKRRDREKNQPTAEAPKRRPPPTEALREPAPSGVGSPLTHYIHSIVPPFLLTLPCGSRLRDLPQPGRNAAGKIRKKKI